VICANPACGEKFTPRSRVQRTCGKKGCRQALFRAENAAHEREGELRRDSGIEAQERIVGLLAHLGAEERALAQDTDLSERERLALARDRLRMTSLSRWCSCNGSGAFDFDQDGDPFCVRCGGPVAGVESSAARKLSREVLATEPAFASAFVAGLRRGGRGA
jgi:hypothetical protein